MRLTDVGNEVTCQALLKIVNRISYNKLQRLNRNQDEIVNLHPALSCSLEADNWQVAHHVYLASGKIIDIVAKRDKETLIVECKKELYGTHLFHAVGQVMCYVAEYGHSAQPVLACLAGHADAYAYQSCQALGIQMFEVHPQ